MSADIAVMRARHLSQRVVQIFSQYPKYLLDSTWPSIGVADLLLSKFRGQERFSADEKNLIGSVSAYVAMIAFSCWKQFADDVSIRLIVKEEPELSIGIEATGGTEIPPGDRVYVNITSAIKDCLSANPLPFFEQSSAHLGPEDNRLSHLAVGLLTGLSSFGDGPWKERSLANHAAYTRAAELFMAAGSASYYRRNFPSEPTGQKGELYMFGLLMPPLFHQEQFYAANAAYQLARHLVDQKVPAYEMLQLAINLGHSPDPQIAAAGTALSIALLTGPIPSQIYGLCYSRGKNLQRLRPAVILARRALGKPADWAELVEDDQLEQATALVEIERSLGLIPFFRLPAEYLNEQRMLVLWESLAASKLDSALEVITTLRGAGVFSVDLALQEAYLRLQLNDLDEAEALLRLAEKRLSDLGPESASFFYEIGGMLSIVRGSPERAIPLLEKAVKVLPKLCTSDHFARAVYFAFVLSSAGQIERALPIFESCIENQSGFVSARLGRFQCLTVLERHDEARTELDALVRFAPMSAEVFQQALNFFWMGRAI